MAFLRGVITEPFARPGVELCGDAIAVVLRQGFRALALGEVLADQTVGVLVGAVFPRMMGRGEVEPGADRSLDGGVAVDRLHVEGVPQDEGDRFAVAEVGQYQVNIHSTETTRSSR